MRHSVQALQPWHLGSCAVPEKAAAAWGAFSAAAVRKQALSRRVGWEFRGLTRTLGLTVSTCCCADPCAC